MNRDSQLIPERAEQQPETTRKGSCPVARFPLTVIILTYNEEVNIRDCLRSVDWAADVIVVDSGSRDRTIEMARATRPDVRVFTHPFQDFGDQRNWALDRTRPRHEWILFLDADERCTPKCAEAIRCTIADSGDKVGYYLCYRNFFLGRWIKQCTYFPSWQLRLLRLGTVRFRKEGHGQREVTDGPLGYVHEPYDHFGFSKGVAEWISRHNVYSSETVDEIHRLRGERLEVRELFATDPVRRRRCVKRIAARLAFRPMLHFLDMYILRRGFLDGRAGLLFCLLRFANDLHITVKLGERRATKSNTRAKEPIHGNQQKPPARQGIDPAPLPPIEQHNRPV